MTCDTEHTEAVIASGRCGECGQLWCPQGCGPIEPSERRIEHVPTTWDEQGYRTEGCAYCLPPGRHVYMPIGREWVQA